MAQRVLTNMRKEMYYHIITLPLTFFRKTQPGMVVQSLVTELASCGDYVGGALAYPLINLLTLLFFAIYLFSLDWMLALISLSIYPIIIFLVPYFQKKVNDANRKRINVTRTLSNRITDTITGIHEVHGHGSYTIESKKFNKLAEKLYHIRIIWGLYQQIVKLTNNTFTNLGPFLIFLIGGYLIMKGQLELGSLVAFLSAQEKLYDPWKELIAFYQVFQDSRVKYARTMEYFDVEPDFELLPENRPLFDLEGRIEVRDLSYETEEGIRLLDHISFDLKPGEHLALVGFSGSGKSTLAQCIGQLYKYSGGSVYLGGEEVSRITKADVINNMGFVSQTPFIFTGTIEENLLYSCLARRSGKPEGEEALPTLDEIISVLQQTGVFVDVLRFGLNAILTREEQHEDLVRRVIKVRSEFQAEFGEELAEYVEFFKEDQFLYHSSVSENLTFGTANRDTFQDANLPQNELFLAFLDSADLTRPLLSLGAELSKQTVDILGNLPPEPIFFEQSPIAPDELDFHKELVERLGKFKLHQLPETDRQSLLGLALRFTPARHKMVALPVLLENLILEGRALFKERIATEDPEAFSFFQMGEYMYSQTILNNILFGKPKASRATAQDRINQSIIQLLIEEDFLETVVKIGMQFNVGSKGDNLSGGQRQKLAIARAFLKTPRLLIMDEATSALDNKSQARVQNQLETRWKGKTTLIAVVHRLDITKNYDRIAVMKAGKIVEIGAYDELINKKGMLYELAVGKK